MDIIMQPVAIVKNERKEPEDDHWGNIISEIVLYDHIPQDALANISMFSHLQIIYYFNQLPGTQMNFARKPRGNPDYPIMGVFAQRNKDRPNSIGLCTVELLEHEGRKLVVKYLDAIDGTPVLDIKPFFRQYQPKTNLQQPDWVDDLMKAYW